MDTNDISACEKLVMKVIWDSTEESQMTFITSISHAEKLVMKVIWDSTEELALQEVMDGVNHENGKNWKPQTVSTFLSRLVKKGFLNMYRKGRYCYYQPLVSKEDFWRATMEESAKFFTKGDLGELACCLCDDMLDAKDIEKLKKKLNEHS